MADDDIVQGDRQGPPLSIRSSRGFCGWLEEEQVSLAVTTYQAHKLLFLGLQPDGRPSLFERTLNRCMGIARHGSSLWVSSLVTLWRFENVLPPGQQHKGFDRYYIPQTGHMTSDIDIHDVVVEDSGRVIFVNTLFGCLATPSETHGFVPVWKPPFLSKLAAEDRCHLNGLGLENGKAAYVTCVSTSDVADGWRDRRQDGGIVMDVRTSEIVARGLSMPHSPRVHNGKIWVVEAGTGYLGYVDREKQALVRVAFIPGYVRGLSFVGDYAVVGHSKARKDRTFDDLELGKNLKERDADPRCGLSVVDLNSGDIVHWFRIDSGIDELFDVCPLPGARRPKAVGFVGPEVKSTHTWGDWKSL